ncbi:MAG: hypothetical protein WCX31_08525 [Salinivirgaceae bacterium]|jgi:hypothetical protein
MPINFFDIVCKTESKNNNFGLCDDTPPPEKHAYIDEKNPSNWIGKVKNSKNKQANFYAIDNCVTILKADGVSKESRCDGMLHFDNSILFVELKMRGSSGWLVKARKQLTITLNKFKLNNNIYDFEKIEAYACNGLKPLANQGNNIELQKFKDDTGLIMYAQQDIVI